MELQSFHLTADRLLADGQSQVARASWWAGTAEEIAEESVERSPHLLTLDRMREQVDRLDSTVYEVVILARFG